MQAIKTRLLAELIRAGAFRFQQQGDIGFGCAHHDNKTGPAVIYREAARSTHFVSLRTPDNGQNVSGQSDPNAKRGTVPRELIERAGRIQALLLRELKLGIPSFVTGVPHAGEPFADGFEKQAKAFGWNSMERLRFVKGDQRRFTLIGEAPNTESGNCVVVPDDVLTLADVKYRFRRALPDDLIPVFVVLVDRQEGGKEILAKLGIDVHTVFTIEEVVTACTAEGLLNKGTVTSSQVLDYAAHRRRLVSAHMDEILAHLREAA